MDEDWLTVSEDGVLRQGPLTIIGTGSTPLSRVLAAQQRYIFFDAPLVDLDQELRIDDRIVEWSPHISPMASAQWLWSSYYSNAASIKRFSDQAHKRGIKCRWWGVARWPTYLRNALWNLQLEAEVDWINADDLSE